MIRRIDDDLKLRRATPTDTNALAEFHARLHSLPDGSPDPGIDEWVRCLMTGSHPTFEPEDFLIVEHEPTRSIASSLCLIDQPWSYDGVPLPAGRPELVATAPEFRRRGLVREQMEVVHEWSRDRGQLMQVIIGIPWFYRQFGYEMALDYYGGRSGCAPLAPLLGAHESEAFHFRPATADDIPLLKELAAKGAARYLLTCTRDDATWRYELETARGVNQRAVRIIERIDGYGGDDGDGGSGGRGGNSGNGGDRGLSDEGGNGGAGVHDGVTETDARPVGILAHPMRLHGGALAVTLAELSVNHTWHEVGPSMLRYVASLGAEIAEGEGVELAAYSLALGSEHPAYHALGSLLPRELKPYAWYVRVPDVPRLLMAVSPALDRRLAASHLRGLSGELHLSFYTSGVRIELRGGRVREVAAWEPSSEAPPHTAAFPELSFLQLLMGRRAFDDLSDMLPDCSASSSLARDLVSTLFPRQPSAVWAVS
ncbi:MAG: GNAT family N-acetyltransferase [Anaerolineae bacterium]|jgi:GNAT superfamily N-acetyltransferase